MPNFVRDRAIKIVVIETRGRDVHKTSLKGGSRSRRTRVHDGRELSIIQWRLVKEPAVPSAVVVELDGGGHRHSYPPTYLADTPSGSLRDVCNAASAKP